MGSCRIRRDAVQISQENQPNIDFQVLAEKLAPHAEVEYNPYLLRCRLNPYEITVFENGRTIVKGTEDPNQAKSLYAKYIGV